MGATNKSALRVTTKGGALLGMQAEWPAMVAGRMSDGKYQIK